MKYIVTKTENGVEELFMFPKSINHDCMAEVLGRIKDQSYGQWRRVYREPIAAGFIRTTYDGLECYGRSETLNLDSRGRLDEMLTD